MMRGKLDEELARMSMIADRIAPHSVVLFNESFAATNEREGSEIGHQIVNALLEAGVKVLFVTHQFTLADAFHTHRFDTTLFLRAERGSTDGLVSSSSRLRRCRQASAKTSISASGALSQLRRAPA